MKRTLCSLIALAAISLLSACASNRDVKRIDNDLDQVRAMASDALIEAKAARIAANDARANSAQTEEMLNRSFQRSMRK